MSYINNMNPRRMIWFNQNAPKNKIDLWLSYNKHYEDTSEDETTDTQETTDNPSQRNCDLILKAWDCGKWVPIVGFNTTSANKIDIVTGVDYTIDGVTHSGKNVYHPAIFTAESPNELYDAGSFGELLNNTNFVTPEDWEGIYDTYLKTIIEQYPFDLWPAEQNELGGIFADRFASTHIDSTAANKTWMAQCKYKYNASSNYNLYIHAKDIISAVNTYTTDNPSAPGIQPSGDFELWLANTERIGGIRAEQDPNTADDCRNIPIVLAGPTVGSVWGLDFGTPGRRYLGDSDYNTEYLYLPGWALLEWMKNPYFNQQDPQPFISGWKGVDVQLRQNSDLVWVGLSGVIPENTGKFCTVQLDNTDPSGATIEWVDLPSGTTYTAGVGIYIPSGNTINIQTSGASNNYDLLSYNGSGDVKWVELSDDGVTTTRMLVGNQIVISSTNKDTIYVPDASGNVLISTTVSTESSGNYKLKEHCVYKPQVLGPSGTSLHYLTIVNNGATVVNKSYVRFKTSSLGKPMLYFNKDTKYVPSYSVSGVTATYDSTGNTNYIQLEESTDYLLDIMFDYIKLEKIIDVSNF